MRADFPASIEWPASPIDWLELALDYRCNLRCLGCRACDDTGESLTTDAVRTLLRDAIGRNIRKLWIGGGEPTLRPDLLTIVASARKLGFSRVLLQTNALRLAYPAYVDVIVRAGVTDVRVNVKTHQPALHDALSRRDGAHALLLDALALLRAKPIAIGADILLTKSTAPELPATVRFFAERGVRHFLLWLLSAADSDEPEVLAEVPSFTTLAPLIEQAADVARELGVQLASLHTPPCTLSPRIRDRFLPASALQMLVVDASGRSFSLEQSSFEGGADVPACQRCEARSSCGGARADYVRIHGDTELIALDEAPTSAQCLP